MGLVENMLKTFNWKSKSEEKGSDEWFKEICIAINFSCQATSNKAKNFGFFRLRTDFVPTLMDMINRISESKNITKEMKGEILKICKSHFVPLIAHCERNNFFKDDVDFLKKVIGDIEKQLTN
jgi:tyrosine-protein phosphatase YwqE